jgi:hypothetical protein
MAARELSELLSKKNDPSDWVIATPKSFAKTGLKGTAMPPGSRPGSQSWRRPELSWQFDSARC